MNEKLRKEWFLEVPWGQLAMVSWGSPSNPPVLLVHGYVDTAATFYPLVRLLPDTLYYVAFDLPGHGRSDATPGPAVTYVHFVDVIRHIVDHMRWDSFICIAHSMGYLISSYYNAVFPGRMSKIVNLDGTVGFGLHAMGHMYPAWYDHCYARYYKNYFPPPKPPSYTYEDAISVLMKARGITDEQAAVLATRCLEPEGDGTYRMSWDPKVKKIASVLCSFDVLYAILAKNTPTLNVVASDSTALNANREFTKKMVDKLKEKTSNYLILNVKGGHNIHFTDPESFVEFVIEFLNNDFGVKSKL